MIMQNKYIISLMLIFTISACDNQEPKNNLKDSMPSVVDAYIPLKGIYVWGEGVEAFTPCGQDKDYWILLIQMKCGSN